MDRHELAWAAGFFDGEGWANRSGRGVQARINQASLEGQPEVLIKFQRIVGVGRLMGPKVLDGKQDLYWWEATSRPDIARVADLIGPWLCPVKRAEFERTLGRSLAPAIWPASASEERGWAGGFFDGEGSTVSREAPDARGVLGAAPLRPAVVEGRHRARARSTRCRAPRHRDHLRGPTARPQPDALQTLARLRGGRCATWTTSAVAVHRRGEAIAGTDGHAGGPLPAQPPARQSGLRRRRSALLPKWP